MRRRSRLERRGRDRFAGGAYRLAVLAWLLVASVLGPAALIGGWGAGYAEGASDRPTPLLAEDRPVDWWFVFKFGAKAFPGCGSGVQRSCPFGGTAQAYKAFGQQFVYASSDDPSLQKGGGCAGGTSQDPVGATFGQIYDHPFNFVIWNDQFYDDPKIQGCTTSCSGPWGHSKGMLAWNDAGEGVALQVTTPSWPAAGSRSAPRKHEGNTLGCLHHNNVLVAQHFFALKLTKDDLVKVLKALQNASVVTDPGNPQIVRNGGPPDVQDLVASLGKKSTSERHTRDALSAGVDLISKPSRLHVPPWQMLSAVLGGVSLRTATWWANPKIYTTTASKQFSCWEPGLGKAGRVEIATSGEWNGTEFGLTGGPGPNFNHAKIGVSISSSRHYVAFGDLNQQGALTGKCDRSQNGRGGLFYVLEHKALTSAVAELIDGDTAPTKAPPQPTKKP